jgi:hypothetical protein
VLIFYVPALGLGTEKWFSHGVSLVVYGDRNYHGKRTSQVTPQEKEDRLGAFLVHNRFLEW